MGVILSAGNRSSVLFGASSTKPQVGALVANSSRSSLLFGSTLVITAVVFIPPGIQPKFTGPPDFCLLEAILGDLSTGPWPISSSLTQRIIKCVLDGGILYYSTNPAGLRRAMPFLEEAEFEIFRELIQTQRPKVVHQYPRTLATAPTIAIRSGRETMAVREKLLYDYAEMGVDRIGDVRKDKPVETFQVSFDSHFAVGIYADDIDATIFWYEAAKYILLQSRRLMAKLGIDSLFLRGGAVKPTTLQDVDSDPFMRELEIRCRTRQVWAQDTDFVDHLELLFSRGG